MRMTRRTSLEIASVVAHRSCYNKRCYPDVYRYLHALVGRLPHPGEYIDEFDIRNRPQRDSNHLPHL